MNCSSRSISARPASRRSIRARRTSSRPCRPAAEPGKTDLNNIGYTSLQDYLLKADPLHLGTDAPAQYGQIARAIVDFRDKTRGGVLNSVADVSSVAPPPVVQALQQDFFTSNFGVRNVDIVGPQVGAQLRKQAMLATLYSLLGMLIYLWFRFELIYGVAAVVACFHDTLITVGAFSLLNTEISLTVIAAILTLVGYSMNDTIVVFDRIRENIKLLRKDSLTEIVNKSINQTLSRTVLTSGLTFLTVLALFVFGGEVLHGFSLALVIGIIIGTYSSIFIAAPMLVAYQQWRGKIGSWSAGPFVLTTKVAATNRRQRLKNQQAPDWERVSQAARPLPYLVSCSCPGDLVAPDSPSDRLGDAVVSLDFFRARTHFREQMHRPRCLSELVRRRTGLCLKTAFWNRAVETRDCIGVDHGRLCCRLCFRLCWWVCSC